MKKLLSCVTAVCLGALTVAPMVSNAIYNVQDSNSSVLDRFNDKEKYVEIENKYKDLFFVTVDGVSLPMAVKEENLEKTVFYSTLDGKDIYAIVPIEPMFFKNGINEVTALFNLTDGTTAEQVNELLTNEFGYPNTIEKYLNNPDYDYRIIGSNNYFKKACDLLKNAGYVDSFVIPGGYVQIIEFNSNTTPLGYIISDDKYKEVEDYVNKNELGELEFVTKCFNPNSIYTLNSDKEISLNEKLDISLKLCKETGIIMNYEVPESMGKVGIGVVDVFNAVNGDANCDKSATMADAAAILQAIGNPDKYALSDQGEFNADYAGDGLTPDDAIAIQKKLTGIE